MGRTRKIVCSKCYKLRWISKKGLCKPCGLEVACCANCNNEKKIYVRGLCYLCYEESQARIALSRVADDFIPASNYNAYLFDLYLLYVRRYRVAYHHIEQAKRFKIYLEFEKIGPLTSWLLVDKLSHKVKLPHQNTKKNGCAIMKIGRILQELGVLPPRETDIENQLQSSIELFTSPLREVVTQFSQTLRKTRRGQSTIIHALREIRRLNEWSSLHKGHGPFLLSTKEIKDYFDGLEQKSSKGQHKRYSLLNQFFKWSVDSKLILKNPLDTIPTSREQEKLTVCSPEQLKQLTRFIKNGKSDPEQALLLSLVLYFGLTTENLANATIDITDNSLNIHIYRRKRTKGAQFYNREQTLVFPYGPKWLVKLQARFIEKWSEHYHQVKKTYPHQPLCLPYHNHHNRFLDTSTVLKRVYQATEKAVEEKIPVRVLRQTCGVLYSQNGDAYALTRLGWSRQFAFHYTWLPQNYFS